MSCQSNVWQISEFVSFIFSDFGQTEELHQPHPITTARLGDSVTLQCFHSLDLNKMTFYWYKQVLGGKPSPLAFSHPDGTSVKNKRASIQRTKESLHLTIKNINPSDEAVYFCGWNNDNNEIEFGNGSFLTLKSDSQHEPKTTAVIQIPVLHGDSVNLRCTSSSQDFRVFWFRPTSGEFHPASIYTEITSGDHCEILSGTSSCIYEFTKDKLGLSDAGMYCCAVATCGKIIFGNGTKLELLVSGLFLLIIYVTYTCLAGGHHNQEGASPRARHGVTNVPFSKVPLCYIVTLPYGVLLMSVHISKKKRRERRKRDLPEDVVYSDVKYSTNVQ
uniref:Ig-like domain-containing protein n=1 Tax=Denticeps clupeoides TaxID=299321 RepID=A0AAY4EDA9_9TELE